MKLIYERKKLPALFNKLTKVLYLQQGIMKKEIEKTLPLAYFITFSCYGTHLHWQESGSVDRDNNQFGKPFLSLDAKKYQHNKKKMKQNPYIIDNKRGEIILKAIIETSMYRQWNLLAAHIRSTHVHIIIQAMVNPEKVMNDLKAYASRALNKSGFDDKNQKRWTRHGSTRYLWKIENIEQAIHYVLYEQGEPMVIYENKNMDIENFFNKTY